MILKRFKLSFCLCCLLASGRLRALADAPAELSPSAQSIEASRPILQASLQGLADFGTGPLQLRAPDLVWLVPSAVGLGVLLNDDVPLYARLAKGDARKDWLDHSMPLVTDLGEGWIDASAAGLAWWLGDSRLARTSAAAEQGLVIVAVYGELLKLAAWSNRPSEDDSAHRFWAYDQSTQGMPSGHSFSAFCMAEIYGAEYGRVIPYTLATAVAYSRIYNQAHWPSDVFAGSLLGILAGIQTRHASAEKGVPAFRLSVTPYENTPVLTAQLRY